jgi:SAM-dependent methyltransferase
MNRHDFIDWPKRLAGELALLERLLADAPSRRVLDLGCGEGQHLRLLAGLGFEGVGIDGSEDVLDRAQDEPLPEGVQLLLAEMGAVEMAVRGHFGAAICLGNTLPYLLDAESLSRMLIGLRRRLLPGAPLLLQVLNYERIFASESPELPVETIPSAQGDLEIVRQVEPRSGGIVLHTTSAARVVSTPGNEAEVVGRHSNLLRGWRRAELETLLDVARFSVREVYGDMKASQYYESDSIELVIVAG